MELLEKLTKKRYLAVKLLLDCVLLPSIVEQAVGPAAWAASSPAKRNAADFLGAVGASACRKWGADEVELIASFYSEYALPAVARDGVVKVVLSQKDNQNFEVRIKNLNFGGKVTKSIDTICLQVVNLVEKLVINNVPLAPVFPFSKKRSSESFADFFNKHEFSSSSRE